MKLSKFKQCERKKFKNFNRNEIVKIQTMSEKKLKKSTGALKWNRQNSNNVNKLKTLTGP